MITNPADICRECELKEINHALYAALDTQCAYCVGRTAPGNPCDGCITGEALKKARGEIANDRA